VNTRAAGATYTQAKARIDDGIGHRIFSVIDPTAIAATKKRSTIPTTWLRQLTDASGQSRSTARGGSQSVSIGGVATGAGRATFLSLTTDQRDRVDEAAPMRSATRPGTAIDAVNIALSLTPATDTSTITARFRTTACWTETKAAVTIR